MQTFLNQVVESLISKNIVLSDYTIILPSRRAGVFLKNEIKNQFNSSIILPRIISIEDFIEELSSLTLIDNTTLLFEFYKIFKQYNSDKNIEDFNSFTNWASTLLNDFNEIDRQLIDTKYLFDYLKDIKRIEHLLEGKKETELIKKHIKFFENLGTYYFYLNEHLKNKKLAYQGQQYREAYENINFFIDNIKTTSKFLLIGFNALNKAEENIFKEMLESGIAEAYWDLDIFYYNTNFTNTTFIKKYLTEWNYYKNNPYTFLDNNFSFKKNIKIVGAPKNITQIKYVSEVLPNIEKTNKSLENTALVLSDESLLIPTLNSLPHNIKDVNITMGYELKNISIFNLFEQLLKLHINKKNRAFYYKNIISLLSIKELRYISNTEYLLNQIKKNNFIYLSNNDLKRLNNKKDHKIISFLFENWDSIDYAISNCLILINLLKGKMINTIDKEYLFRFNNIFQQISNLNNKFGYITNLKTLHQFYLKIIGNEKLSFRGEPLSGLQIMGVLETRVLDFKNLIITSVNEGILPSGRSENSFIPYDIKKEVGLPTYQEKDAIFSYHFFRLLQRAENIYILYNTESDNYGTGEQSRFLKQLELLKNNEIEGFIISPKVNNESNDIKSIQKNASLLNQLKLMAGKGISPTTLTTYILNPFEFYKKKILKINDVDEVEETIAANTLGTIIHKTLESLYKPYVGQFLTENIITHILKNVSNQTNIWFRNEYLEGNIKTGKNLLVLNVAKQFITNFLKSELTFVKNGDSIKILALEKDLSTNIKIKGIDYPIKLIGQADRIDEKNGTFRIIDYKTGKIEQKHLTINDWGLLTTDYEKYSKSFQVLFYAFLYSKMNDLDLNKTPIESGIFSFKNLRSGFLKINKSHTNQSDLDAFEIQLKNLIKEIFNTYKQLIDSELSYN